MLFRTYFFCTSLYRFRLLYSKFRWKLSLIFFFPLPITHIRFGYTPVQQRLSCLAKENVIYIVVNVGDKKPCNASDPHCPSDGRYQYNTDVVFDSEGRLVARYHKVKITCILKLIYFLFCLFVIRMYICLLNVDERAITNTFLNCYILVEKGI